MSATYVHLARLCWLSFCMLQLAAQLAAQDTSYFDKAWKPARHRAAAAFMRIAVEQGTGYTVNDYYYPSMKKQMTGAYKDAAHKTEHGYFTYYENTGNKASEGTFVEGKKEGVWKYYRPGEMLWYTYTYKHDKQDGESYTFFEDGSKRRIEVYAGGELRSGNCYTRAGKDTLYYPMEQLPEYPGGVEKLYIFLVENVKYPKKARRKEKEGKVLVKFIVDETGKITHTEIVSSPDPLFSAEALRVMALMPAWKPGRQEEKNVPVMYTLPIKFQFD